MELENANLASTQQGRNRTLFKVGKVSTIMDTLPTFFAYYAGFIGNLYPFRRFYVIWVEICERRYLDSLPFSADFRYLGRDLRTGELELYPFRRFYAIWVEICDRWLLESLPFSPDLHHLGRDFQQAGSGISTFSDDFRYLGRFHHSSITKFSTLSYFLIRLGKQTNLFY